MKAEKRIPENSETSQPVSIQIIDKTMNQEATHPHSPTPTHSLQKTADSPCYQQMMLELTLEDYHHGSTFHIPIKLQGVELLNQHLKYR